METVFRKVLFVYNSSSGEISVTDYLDRIISMYHERGFCMIQYRICFDKRDRDILSYVDDTYDHILMAGGDGSINYFVNLLKKSQIDIPLGILPAGTANDFAALLGMPSNILDAAKAILDGEEGKVDLGIANGNYFVNVFSCGLFTDVSQKTPTIWKNNLGKIAYYIQGIGDIPKFRKMELSIESDGGSFEGEAIIFFVFNGCMAGTLPLAYLSEGDDGLLDVLILKSDNFLDAMRTAIKYLPRKRRRKDYPPGIIHFRCTSLKAVSAGNETTDIDGQPGPSFPIEIQCAPSALRIIRPKQ